MAKNIEKKTFDPNVNLRFCKETFVHDDKVVGERFRLQYKPVDWDHWFNIKTHEEMTKIYNLINLPDWDGVVLRPGVKEQIEELKEDNDD